ncbi:MAG: helix-hairpin-helix domain-containing protein [Oscillochloridaceae bacterium]|nr:helix-hairpin-helix domain-containing protein [Chloroflexaceae bacterium]MDW8390810.1 helix-hairpin-helix domain-containing protein [Oscillochloridaceae bacterium]
MNLIYLWWLTLGVLIGFVAEWIWDWIWFRRRRQVVSVDVETQVNALRGERDKLAADLRACGDRRAALESELKTAQGTLQTVQDELGSLRTRVATLSQENDQLRAELAALRAAASAPASAQGQTLMAKQVGTADETTDVAMLREYNLALHDELAATRLALGRLAGSKGDPLTDIRGIGPAYQERLYAAGVLTFEQVAATHPDRLRAIADPETTTELDTEAWREQARQLAHLPGRDPLIDINGIGPVYEQRLLNAGVTSFEQLASMTEEQIRAIIKPEAWQNVDIPAWIAEAKVFAQQVRDGTYRKGRR